MLNQNQKEIHIEEYSKLKEYLESIYSSFKDKKIVKICYSSTYLTSELSKGRIYNTCAYNYIVFDDNSVIKFDYEVFSIMDIIYTNLDLLTKEEKNIIDDESYRINLEYENCNIIDYEIESFSDEYIINPTTDETRPSRGDYFKEIVFHLNNGKKLCICAENAEFDGYCDIWMEDNNEKGKFNGQSHSIWWDENAM